MNGIPYSRLRIHSTTTQRIMYRTKSSHPDISRLLTILTVLLCSVLLTERAPAAYPDDPTADTEWPYSSESTVADIEERFNTARTNENNQLGTSVPPLVLPSQTEWDDMSDNEKALWLVNRERIDRGVAPLDDSETNVTEVAQAYADYLLAHDVFGHNADGNSPWDRLNNNAAIGDCHDFLNIAENLAVLWGGWTLPLERAIFMWMYEDQGSGWGHRHAILWYPYNDNSGAAGREGFLGIGRVHGTHNDYSNSDIVVLNLFDPCAAWAYTDLPGDLDGDGDTDLTDLIIALQVSGGLSIAPSKGGDVDGDGQIGLAEALYIINAQ